MPTWFDLAQDLTERWVHQMQMRRAVDHVAAFRAAYLPVVMQTMVWAFPAPVPRSSQCRHQRAARPGAGGRWTLTSDGVRWHLDPGADDGARREVHAADDAGWRWLTGGAPPAAAIVTSGPQELVEPLLQVERLSSADLIARRGSALDSRSTRVLIDVDAVVLRPSSWRSVLVW